MFLTWIGIADCRIGKIWRTGCPCAIAPLLLSGQHTFYPDGDGDFEGSTLRSYCIISLRLSSFMTTYLNKYKKNAIANQYKYIEV